MSLMLSRVFAFPTIVAIVSLAGCATSNKLVTQWSNPAYTSPSFKRIMVGGLGPETSIRRNFEDEFVAQLRAAGVDALPSYRYMPEDEKINEAKLKQAAQNAGVDAVIIARSVGVEQKTELGPSYYPTPSFGIFGRNVGAVWHGLYGAPSVRRYHEYTSETTLYDVAKGEVVWTGTIKTTEPENVNTAIRDYVEAVMQALNEKNLLSVKK
ncbi:MAG: hypothetical protein ACREQ7_21110 [Candidatus Binatia bacterium]